MFLDSSRMHRQQQQLQLGQYSDEQCVEELLLHDANTTTTTTTTVSSLDVQVDDVVYDIGGEVMMFSASSPSGATIEELEFILGT